MKLLIAFVVGLLAGPIAADAQPAGKIPLIGVLAAGIPTTYTSRYEAFRQGLREVGYVGFIRRAVFEPIESYQGTHSR